MKNLKQSKMKKIITLLSLLSILSFSNAQVIFQSNFQNWSNGVPSNWFGSASTISNPSVLQQFTGSAFGTYLCGLSNSGSTGLGLATQSLGVVGGTKYKLEIYLESNMGDMAIGYYDLTNSTYGPITTYRSAVSTSSGILVIDSLTVPSNCVSAQFIVYAKNTAAFGIGNIGVSLDRVVISVLGAPSTSLPSPYKPRKIYDIQYTIAASGDSPFKDSLIETSGIVTAVSNEGYWIQDSANAWNGIYVFDTTNTPAQGDKIIVRAEVYEFFGLTELKDVDTLITISTTNTLPTVTTITATDMNNEEKYEGVLCKINNSTCTNTSIGFGEWLIYDNTDTAVVDDLIYAFVPTLNSAYNVTGVVHYSFGDFKIEPRYSFDIVRVSSVTINENENFSFNAYPNPVNNWITISGDNLDRVEVYSASGKLVQSSSIITINRVNMSGLSNGIYFVKVYSGNESAVSRIVKQ